MNEIAVEMELEYKRAMKAELAGDLEGRKRHLENAYRLRNQFLDEYLGEADESRDHYRATST